MKFPPICTMTNEWRMGHEWVTNESRIQSNFTSILYDNLICLLFSGTLILAICHAAITWRSNLWYGPHIYVVGPRALFVVFIRHLFVTQSRFADNIIQEQCLLIMLQELMFMDVKVCLRYVITINKIMGSSVQFLHQLIIGCIKAEGIQCPKCLYYQAVQLFYCATSKNHEKLARLVTEHILI